MVDLDDHCLVKIHEAESTENTGRTSRLKILKCDQNFACSSICDYDQIITLTELRNKNKLVSGRWSLNNSLIS